MFHVELWSYTESWTEPFIWTPGVNGSNSVDYDQVQVLSYSKYSLLVLLVVRIEPSTSDNNKDEVNSLNILSNNNISLFISEI